MEDNIKNDSFLCTAKIRSTAQKLVLWLILLEYFTICFSVVVENHTLTSAQQKISDSELTFQNGMPELRVFVEKEQRGNYKVINQSQAVKSRADIKRMKTEWVRIKVNYSQQRLNTILGNSTNRFHFNCTAPYLTRWTSNIVPTMPATYGHANRYSHNPFQLPASNKNVSFVSQIVFMLPNSMSGYIQCESVQNSSVATKAYIYAQGIYPIVWNNQRDEFEPPIITDTSKSFTVPCRVNSENVTLKLYKIDANIRNKEEAVNTTETIGDYDPQVGFVVRGNEDLEQRYKCKTLERSMRQSNNKKRTRLDRIGYIFYKPRNTSLKFFIGSQRDTFPLAIWCKTGEITFNQIKMIHCDSPYECDWLSGCFYDACKSDNLILRKSAIPDQPDRSNAKIDGIIKNPFTRGKVICVSKKQDAVAYDFLFTGLDRHRYWMSQGFPKTAIIYMAETETLLYSNKPATFACETSNYILHPNIKFAVIFQNGTNSLLETVGSAWDSDILIDRDLGFSRKQIVTNVSTDMVGIMCLAPWLNSSNWIHTSRNFEVKDVKAPLISMTGERTNRLVFYIGDKSRSLFCNATGEPQPVINWTVPREVDHKFENVNKMDTTLHFPIIEDSSFAGKYHCSALNYYGKYDFFFNVEVQIPSQGLNVQLIIAMSAALGGLVIGLAFLIRKYIQAKKEIEDLTPEEVNEFINGLLDDKNDDKNLTANDTDVTVEVTAFASPAVEIHVIDSQQEVSSDSSFQEVEEMITENDIKSMKFDRNFNIQVSDIQIVDSWELGHGTFGKVNGGFFKGEAVAIKTTKPNAGKQNFITLLYEIKTMQYIAKWPHPNILQYIGAVVNEHDIRIRKALLVVELSPLGNLEAFLQNLGSNFMDLQSEGTISLGGMSLEEIEKNISTFNLVSWCEQIASGMDFLTKKKVIHGDLAARNVLRFKNNVVKITDFGLSRKLYSSPLYLKKYNKNMVNLPQPWMAIESLKFLQFSSQSDVWSFGVTAWEIYSMGQLPLLVNDFTYETVITALQKGDRLGKPTFAPESIYTMMLNCWRLKPSDRPSFSSLENLLGDILKSMRRTLEEEDDSNRHPPPTKIEHTSDSAKTYVKWEGNATFLALASHQ